MRPSGFRQASMADKEPVQPRLTAISETDHAPDHRLRYAGDVERHVKLDGGFRIRHTGKLGNSAFDRLGRALQFGEDIGEARRIVVILARPPQRIVGGKRTDKTGDTGRHYQCDSDGLALHLPKVAHQLSIEHLHQRNSSGVSLRVLRSTRVMRPSARCMTRSAMPAMAALCVITTAVVPSSR